jgi:hypothetical protein
MPVGRITGTGRYMQTTKGIQEKAPGLVLFTGCEIFESVFQVVSKSAKVDSINVLIQLI